MIAWAGYSSHESSSVQNRGGVCSCLSNELLSIFLVIQRHGFSLKDLSHKVFNKNHNDNS